VHWTFCEKINQERFGISVGSPSQAQLTAIHDLLLDELEKPGDDLSLEHSSNGKFYKQVDVLVLVPGPYNISSNELRDREIVRRYVGVVPEPARNRCELSCTYLH
jgi:hypothetical protein